jgi:hypothetical protein
MVEVGTSPHTRAYRQAALTYLAYGVIYLGGAIYLGTVGLGPPAAAWYWYVAGGALVVFLPVLIWKEFKWVTRILAVLVFVRVLGLTRIIIRDEGVMVPMPWGVELSQVYGAVAFLVVAAVTCLMLVRAGWSSRFVRP